MTMVFQPTLPLRGATPRPWHRRRAGPVSTHAPLAGSDRARIMPDTSTLQFQPTLPLRGATASARSSQDVSRFQPTLPLRGATSALRLNSVSSWSFQPTLPLRGATGNGNGAGPRRPSFNPRSPCGERRPFAARPGRARCFNPRSPCGERRAFPSLELSPISFQPTLPLRGATCTRIQ